MQDRAMQIESFRFGCFTINKAIYQHDIKIINDKIKIWNYYVHHTVTCKDLTDILAEKPEVVIIGTGTSGLVNVEEGAKRLVKESNIKILIEKTPEACKYFNILRQNNRKVAAIMHATC